MKNSHPYVTATTYSVLGIAAAVAYVLPPSIMPMSCAKAATPSTSVQLTGTLRDFMGSHPDFDVMPSLGYGHYAGNVQTTLSEDALPTFSGEYIGSAMTDFDIDDGEIEPDEDFAIMVTVLGSSIAYKGDPIPVTFQLEIDNAQYMPFGPWTTPVDSNVNDEANPRRDINSVTYEEGSSVTIKARSWMKQISSTSGLSNGHWEAAYEVDSADDSPFVKMLRNGDPVPDIDGMDDQSSVMSYVVDYLDSSTNTMTMGENQVIMLFELGTDDLTSTAADFQDLVVLITFGTSPEYLQATTVVGEETPSLQTYGYKVNAEWTTTAGDAIAPHLAAVGSPITVCATAVQDNAGSRGGASTGGITDNSTFAQWFTDVPGINQSMPHSIELTYVGDGIFEFESDEFFPATDQLLGNEGEANNYFFTYSISMDCEYSGCGEQFFEVRATDDVWVFVDDQLVIDLGGVIHGATQRIDLDRLGLTDGNTYKVRVFIAQRNHSESELALRTNIFMRVAQINQAYTAIFD
ncbi:MAG: fibro-slime domain-containing protein [Phycisphaerales bacterium]|nr:fibro-slime domain-containing protein [Phycisphaerales bacterium]